MSIQNIFEKFNELTVLVIGDVMIDAYSYGNISRISPEAPVPVVDITSKDKRLGGAANVAKNIKALGAKCVLCSVIGDDYNSEIFYNLLEKNQLLPDAVFKSKNRKTTLKHRIISDSKQILRIDEEDTHNLSDEENVKFLSYINEFIQKADVVILQDYDKGVLGENNISKIIELAKKQRIPIAVDPKRKNFLSYKNVSLFKPNLKEISEGLGLKIDKSDKKSISQAVDALKEKLEIENVLLTLSEKGVYIDFSNYKEFVSTQAKSVADVSGAGDTVISVASMLLALEADPLLIAKLSNLAGGLVCEEPGVVPINKKIFLGKAISLS